MPSYDAICLFKKLVKMLHRQRDASGCVGAVRFERLVEVRSDICHFVGTAKMQVQ